MDKINHWIIEAVPTEIIEKSTEIINRKKIESRLFISVSQLTKEELDILKKVLDVYELTAIDLWPSNNKDKKEKFILICKRCADIYQILPIPENDIDKIKHVLKFVAFSYLGEKWEDGRRFLIEHKDIWNVKQGENKDWDIKLFTSLYKGVLFLIRKNSWQDLQKAINIITKLREEQKKYEEKYFNSIDNTFKRGAAYELASLYHLAKAVDILASYMLRGSPPSDRTISELDFHFERGIQYSHLMGNIEFEVLLRILHVMFKKIVFNSIWRVSEKVNSKVSKFVNILTKKPKPIFELLYPQRIAILEKGLLDPASRGIVVNLPTSSGKTLIAEFRILQALNQFAEEKGWVAYTVPTRALVNQITNRLKRDLGSSPLSLRIEKISGALEIDAFEENLLDKGTFDVLVTTPEKLNLLIRQGIEERLSRPLVLLIVDEAHNIEDRERGLNLEMLISIAKSDCSKANFLLLTPFIPNSDDIARWLDTQNPRSISIELDWWKPNDQVVGIFYAEGKRKKWKTLYEPLITSHPTIALDDKILIGENKNKIKFNFPISKLRNKSRLTSVVARQMKEVGSTLIIARTIKDSWKIVGYLSESFSALDHIDERIELVQKFVAAELGENFPLVRYLSKGIGVHHAGLPDEIRYLMEWLMEEGLLKILVATTTVAQGINFPVSTILMASYSYPFRNMPARDFWNLAGRAGRIDQKYLGVVGIAVKDANDASKAKKFVRESTQNLLSVLVEMVEDTKRLGRELNLEMLANYPEWSAFLQYISHLYNQVQNLQSFASEMELALRRTYGYMLLDPPRRRLLVDAVRKYVQKLDRNKHLAALADQTGFSPESIEKTINKIRELGLTQLDWHSSRLFSKDSNTLKNLIGVMLSVPEIKKNLEVQFPGTTITKSKLASLITSWVSGEEITDISKKFWGGDDPASLSRCVNAIYSKISNSATWGLAAIMQLKESGIKLDELSEEEVKKQKNFPAMIYYGVNTDEAIVMRMNNVPRSIAHQLGTIYKQEVSNIYKVKPLEVTNWLKDLDESVWDSVVPKTKKISGEYYKKIWKKLSGID